MDEVKPVLEARGLSCGYGGHPVVRDLDLAVRPGEVVALLGPNGAGKTTSMLTLAGELPPIDGQLVVDGVVARFPLHRRAAAGLSFVTEERSVFMGLTALENLRLGRCELEVALDLFPELEPLLERKAGLLSGGEQQILTLARALARGPKVLLADELSLGLAPLVVSRLLRAVRDAADRGVAVVLVEQHVGEVLRIADHVHVLQRGRVVLSGPSGEVAGRLSEVQDSYLLSSTTP